MHLFGLNWFWRQIFALEKMARLDPLRRVIARSPTENQTARPETPVITVVHINKALYVFNFQTNIFHMPSLMVSCLWKKLQMAYDKHFCL